MALQIELFPDVVVSQTMSPAPSEDGSILVGDVINITVTLLNNGTYQADNVVVNQTLPRTINQTLPELEYVTGTPPKGAGSCYGPVTDHWH